MKNIFYWHGDINLYKDEIHLTQFQDVHIGIYGGYSGMMNDSSTGHHPYNEDGLMIFKTDQSTFAVLMDGHSTNESVLLLQSELLKHIEVIQNTLQLSVSKSIPKLQNIITTILMSKKFIKENNHVMGETAVLFCYEQAGYLWWLSIGDNSLYVFHPEFNELGQYKVTQRIFYQWVGKASALNLEVPCYQTGTLQLRKGENKILLLTDGVLEINGRPYEEDQLLKSYFEGDVADGLSQVLKTVQEKKGQDNATMVTWVCHNEKEPLRPTRRS